MTAGVYGEQHAALGKKQATSVLHIVVEVVVDDPL
jgi:hypothetical protein